MTITDIGERALIARIRARTPPAPDWVLTGIGDDAAVLRPARGMVDVVTADALVENVHFRRAWATPSDIGHKALAVNLSDLASMGATPRAFLLSIAMPGTLDVDTFDGFIDGILSLAAHVSIPLVGGNLTRTDGPVVIDVTAIGTARPRRILARSGARPGDRLFVTGRLGAAATGLALHQAGVAWDTLDQDRRECVLRYDRPSAHLRTGQIVARNRAASACMDLSDGLADAATQMAEASGCGVEINSADVPIHPGAQAWAAATGVDPLTVAWAGGEDYELLFAVPRRRTRLFLAAIRQAGEIPVTEIGTCTKERTVRSLSRGVPVPLPDGFTHF